MSLNTLVFWISSLYLLGNFFCFSVFLSFFLVSFLFLQFVCSFLDRSNNSLRADEIKLWFTNQSLSYRLNAISFSASNREGRVALSVGHPHGTHSRYVIGCCLIPLGSVVLKITREELPME